MSLEFVTSAVFQLSLVDNSMNVFPPGVFQLFVIHTILPLGFITIPSKPVKPEFENVTSVVFFESFTGILTKP
jgi:hypothetical protein